MPKLYQIFGRCLALFVEERVLDGVGGVLLDLFIKGIINRLEQYAKRGNALLTVNHAYVGLRKANAILQQNSLEDNRPQKMPLFNTDKIVKDIFPVVLFPNVCTLKKRNLKSLDFTQVGK